MASKLWFRLYTEIMDDPKLARWTGDQFRMLIYLFCLAKESDEPGLIKMTPDQIAWRVRRPISEVEETIVLAQEGPRPIIIAQDDGYLVVRFLDRQYEYNSDKPEAVKARVQKHRGKQKNCNDDVTTGNELKRNCNDDVTRNIQSRADTETDNKQSRAECNDSAALRFSDQNEKDLAGEIAAIFQRSLSARELKELQELTQRYQAGLIIEACNRAAARGRPKLHYAKGILSDWAKAKLTTLAAVMEIDPSVRTGVVPQASAESQANKVVELEAKRREEAIRMACDFIRLQCGPGPPPREKAEEIAREYGDELVPSILERLYEGGRSP